MLRWTFWWAAVGIAIALAFATVQASPLIRTGETRNVSVKDDDMLQVWIVPHSHDDVGWIKTVDEYYEQQVRHIYDNVIQSLSENVLRKFIIVEQAFFSRWFDNDATDWQRQQVRTLLKNQQLEFVLGGWVMNDEACVTGAAAIDQISIGHRYLMDTFGIQPRYGYQIDPFGHSAFTPYMYAKMGCHAMIVNRIHYQDKAERQKSGRMEFVWRSVSSANLPHKDTEILTHVLDNHYSAPRGMDFELDPEIGDEPDLERRAKELVADLQNRRHAYPAQSVFLQLAGDDFRWQNASKQFTNWERVIKFINSRSGTFRIQLQFGTLQDYFSALHRESPSFAVKQHSDFFPYADNERSYWTGYFTSKSFLKQLARKSENELRHLELIVAEYSLLTHGKDTEDHRKEEKMAYEAVEMYRKAVAQLQHHDGITGTSTKRVTQMYFDDVLMAKSKVRRFVAKMVQKLVGGVNNVKTVKSLSAMSMLRGVNRGQSVSIMFHNALTFVHQSVQMLVVPSQDLSIEAPSQDIPSQLFQNPTGSGFVLAFPLELNPLQFTKLRLQHRSAHVTPTRWSQLPIQIANEAITVRLESTGKEGRLKLNVHIHATGFLTDLFFDLLDYTSETDPGRQPSGGIFNGTECAADLGDIGIAYIFHPIGPAQRIPVDWWSQNAQFEFMEGPLVQEIRVRYTSGQLQIFRIFSGEFDQEGSVEITTHIPRPDMNRETVFRLHAPAFRDGFRFRTDSSATMMMDRVRATEGTQRHPEIAANFYPVIVSATVDNGEQQISCLTDRPMAVGSLEDGQWEFLVHRRTSMDDSRGVGEPLDDVSSAPSILRLHIQKVPVAEHVRRVMELETMHPPLSFLGLDGYKARAERALTLFDPTWHLHSLQRILPTNNQSAAYYLLRLRKILPRSQEFGNRPKDGDVREFWGRLRSAWGNELSEPKEITEMGLSGVTPLLDLQDRMHWETEESVGGQHSGLLFQSSAPQTQHVWAKEEEETMNFLHDIRTFRVVV